VALVHTIFPFAILLQLGSVVIVIGVLSIVGAGVTSGAGKRGELAHDRSLLKTHALPQQILPPAQSFGPSVGAIYGVTAVIKKNNFPDFVIDMYTSTNASDERV
jgi:hypothetical protein